MIIFFDVDSTLVENRFSRRVVETLFAPVAAATGLTVQALAREMGAENERRQRTDPDHPLTMDWRDIAEYVAAQHGQTLQDDLDALWVAYANADEVDVLDNAPTVLAALKAAGHTLVVATKGLWKYQEPVLRVTGLLPYFDDVLTPDRTGFLKTSPGYFHRYQQDASLPQPFVQVGDHFYDDVICARRNGFLSVMRAPTPALQQALRDLPPAQRPQHLHAYRAHIPTYPAEPTDLLPHEVVISLEEVPGLLEALDVTLYDL
jgi:putative hydrolase of the HAD superfamily